MPLALGSGTLLVASSTGRTYGVRHGPLGSSYGNSPAAVFSASALASRRHRAASSLRVSPRSFRSGSRWPIPTARRGGLLASPLGGGTQSPEPPNRPESPFSVLSVPFSPGRLDSPLCGRPPEQNRRFRGRQGCFGRLGRSGRLNPPLVGPAGIFVPCHWDRVVQWRHRRPAGLGPSVGVIQPVHEPLSASPSPDAPTRQRAQPRRPADRQPSRTTRLDRASGP